MKLLRKTFLLEEKTIEKIEILKEKHTHLTMVDVIRTALNVYWKDTFKYGSDPFLLDLPQKKSSIDGVAERRVQIKQAEEKARQSLKDAPKVAICEIDLGGKVITNPDGSKSCKYLTHTIRGSEEQIIPLSQCGEYLIDNQWIPNKEAVLKYREKHDVQKNKTKNTRAGK
jgi:hypothetical protein